MRGGGWLVEQFAPVGALLHVLAGRRVDRRAAGVPTTTQGLVQSHQAADRVATADQVTVLLLQQQLLSIEHPLKISEAFAVLRAGQIQRALRSLRGLVANGCTLQRAHQPAGSIVGLTGGFALETSERTYDRNAAELAFDRMNRFLKRRA